MTHAEALHVRSTPKQCSKMHVTCLHPPTTNMCMGRSKACEKVMQEQQNGDDDRRMACLCGGRRVRARAIIYLQEVVVEGKGI